MRLPRVRFTVRRLMAVVVVAATLLGPFVYLKTRSARFQATYLEHAVMAQKWGDAFGAMGRQERGDKAIWSGPMARIEYHKRMARKYELAALTPWLSVEPDPPEPK